MIISHWNGLLVFSCSSALGKRRLAPPAKGTSGRSLDAFEFRDLLRKEPQGLVELDILIDATDCARR
jgi:hypothetical protein